MKRILALLLMFVLILSLCACGAKEQETRAPETLEAETESVTEADNGEQDLSEPFAVGDYQALYAGYELIKNKENQDAILIQFDFTNNSDTDMAFTYGMYLQLFQGEEQLQYCTIYLDEDEIHAMDDSIIEIVKPGKTLRVQSTYTLKDLTTPIRVQFSKNGVDELHFATLDITK